MSAGGEVDVDLGPRLRAMIDPPPEATEWTITAAIQAGVALVLGRIIAGWPVATGLSLSGWRQNGTRIQNAVDYAAYVHNGLYMSLIDAAIYDAAARVRETLRGLLNKGGAGKQEFRDRARQRLLDLEARRAQLPTPPRPVSVQPPDVWAAPSPLAPGSLAGVAQELGEAAAYSYARRIGVDATTLALLRRGQVDAAIRRLYAIGRQDQAIEISRAQLQARSRANAA